MFLKWEDVLKSVTVEPMILVYFMTLSLSQTAALNLLLQKLCHPLEEPVGVDIDCSDEIAAQVSVARINTWKPILQNFIPVLFVIFAGPWSDSHGRRRRPLMFLPLIGQILTDAAILVNIYFWQWPAEVTAVFECIFYGFTGGKACFFIGIISYISDITTKDERTSRLGIVTAIFFVGTPIGVGLSGFLRSLIGFYGVFLTSVFFDIVALQLGYMLVKNPPDLDPESTKKPVLEGILDPREIIRAVKTMVKKRPNYERFIILAMIIISTMITCPAYGEYSVLLFYTRYKFQWDEITYGLYVLYKMVVILIGTTFTVGLLSRYYKVRDSIIGIAACSTLIIAATGNAFANDPWELYFFPAVDMMHGAGVAVARSIASKIVPGTELGKKPFRISRVPSSVKMRPLRWRNKNALVLQYPVTTSQSMTLQYQNLLEKANAKRQLNSVMAVSENLIVLPIYPLYNFVYAETFQTLPGAFFLLSAFLAIGPLMLFCYVSRIEKNIQEPDENKKENEKETETTNKQIKTDATSNKIEENKVKT